MTTRRQELHHDQPNERHRLPVTTSLLGGCLAAGLLTGVLACSEAPRPVTPTAPITSDASAAEPSPAAADSPAAEPGSTTADAAEGESAGKDGAEPSQAPGAASESSPNVIMIDRGTGGGKPSLWEVAVAERERRANAKEPVAKVTNENLHEYQDAELTFAKPKAGEDAGAPQQGGEEASADGTDAASAPVETRDEKYWRSRVLDLRARLRDAVDEIDDLEGRIASLRRRFYSEDDPYVRDGQIKPAWDRALDRLSTTHHEVARLRGELSDTLEEGHRAGALPGWLREGIELEPRFDDEEEPTHREGGLPIYEPEEPDTIEPGEPPASDHSTADEPPP